MNVREAILRAADHVERHPRRATYSDPRIPRGEDGTGCFIGWINYFQLQQMSALRRWWNGLGTNLVKPSLLGCWSEGGVFARVSDLADSGNWEDRFWTIHPEWWPKLMRAYADEFYPAPAKRVQHVGIPDSVRAIFTEQVAA